MIYNELIILRTPEIKKNTTVSADPNKHPHIIINMDMAFPNVPCWLIDINMRTSVNSMESSEINKQLTWTHMDPTNNVVDESAMLENPFPKIDINNEEKTVPLIKEFFDKNHTCTCKGRVDVTKVTGQFDINIKGYSAALKKFAKDNVEKHAK